MAGELRPPQLSGASQVNLPVNVSERRVGHELTTGDTARDHELGSVVGALRRRRRSIVVVSLTIFAAVAVFTLQLPKGYRSSAMILVEEPNTGIESSAFAVLDRLGRGSRIETEIELVTSRRVLQRVVDQLDLHVSVRPVPGRTSVFQFLLARGRTLAQNVAGRTRSGSPTDSSVTEKGALQYFRAFDASPSARPGSYRLTAQDSGHFALRDIQADAVVAQVGETFDVLGLKATVSQTMPPEGLEIEVLDFSLAMQLAQERIVARRVGREAGLIQVLCDGSSAEDAHRICASTLDNYMGLRTELQRAEATATATFLRQQANRVGQQLAAAEDSLESYSRRNRVVALQERAGAEVEQTILVKADRDQIEAERAALATLIADIEARAPGTRKYRDLASFPTFLQNLAVTELVTNLVDLENQRSEMTTRRAETSVEVAALDARIAEIESQLRSIAVSYERALTAQINSLDQTLTRADQRLSIIPTQQIQHARLERRADLLEDLYRVLEARLREAEVAEAVELPNVRIVDAASVPFRPASPNVRVNLLLGILLGLAVALAVALYREARDTRIRERQYVERHTGFPVLTLIPHLVDPGPVLALPNLARAGNGSAGSSTGIAVFPGGRGTLKGKKSRTRGTAFVATEDKRVALECFRSLAADIKFTARRLGNDGFRSVAITSSGRSEGKTLTACNLALVRAADGARTLLIDADMRGGRVAMFFGVPPSAPGLSDVLAGSVDMGSVWSGDVNGTEIWVLPAGRPLTQAASLLESPRFNHLIERARLQFDVIVIDTPPLNVITDAATVAAAVDAVVVVVREGVTDRQELEITLERLKRAAGNVVGVVFNDAPLPKQYASSYDYGVTRKVRG